MHHPHHSQSGCIVLHECKEQEDGYENLSTGIDSKQVEILVDESYSDAYIATERKFRF